MHYSIEEITTLTGAHRFGHARAEIGWLLTDSRSLAFRKAACFLPSVPAWATGTSTSPTSTAEVCATL